MRGIGGVMDLMMRGAEKEPPPDSAERNPELRMLQMSNGPKKNQKDDVSSVNGDDIDLAIERPGQHAGRAADEQREHVAENQIIDGMVSVVRERR